MRPASKLAALALALRPGIAHAAEAPCLTPREFTSLATYALPSVITGVSNRCGASLPANAFLRTGAAGLASRYGTVRQSVWPDAKQVFLKVSSATSPQAAELFKALPDPQLQLMTDGLIEGLIAQRVPTDRCGTMDRLLDLLSPLPPESTAEIIGLAAGLGSRAGTASFGAFSICKA